MKVVLVASFFSSKNTDIAHFLLFHGLCSKETNQYCFNLPKPTKLEISRSGLIWPDVFFPSISLIASRAFFNAFGDLKNLELRDVHFKKLVNIKIEPGDFSYYDSKNFLTNPVKFRSDKILDSFPDDKSLHQNQEADYKQFVVPSTYRVVQDESAIIEKKVELKYCVPKQIAYNAYMLDTFEVFGFNPLIFHRAAFDRVSHLFDQNYFTFQEMEL